MNEAYTAVHDYKSKHPCVCCGEEDPAVLEFHHKNPWDKKFTIGTAVRQNMPLSLIFEEAAKCEIVCKPCHIDIHRKWEATGVGPSRKKHPTFRPELAFEGA